MRLMLTKSYNTVLTVLIANRPSDISFMSAIASTAGRLHCEFVRLLFLQAHRETNRFLAASGVQLA
jgi:hypothetical protein